MIPSRPVRTVDVSFAVDSDAAMRLAAARVRVDAIDSALDVPSEDMASALAEFDTVQAEFDAAQAAYNEAGEVTFRARSVGLVAFSEASSIEDGKDRLRAMLESCVAFVDADGVEHPLDADDVDRMLGPEWSEPEVARLLAACRAANLVTAVVEKKG